MAVASLLATSGGCQPPSQDPTPGAKVSAAGASATKPAQLEKFEYVQPKMGTIFRIVLYAPGKSVADQSAAAAFARVDELNGILSDYEPNSELSRLSQRTNDGPMPRPARVSDDLWRVLVAGRHASELSDGAFDVTVGPFVQLWRRSRRQNELPKPERLDEARKSVGYQYLKLDPQHQSVQLLARRMRLDVGGIAKGYTAEQAMAVLHRFGIRQAVVGAAGDLAVGDPPPGRDDWRIGIQSLERPNDIAGYVLLHNRGISTSGDTYRFVEIDGVRYSHIIDPRTGLGLTHSIGVTVIAPDALTSDWSSTAVSILGPEKGVRMIERMPGTAVRIVVPQPGQGAAVVESAGFKGYHFQPAQPAATFPASDDGVQLLE
jgi:thiamine biosynthesis lipoprotein